MKALTVWSSDKLKYLALIRGVQGDNMAQGEGAEVGAAEFEDVAGDFAVVPVPKEQRRTLLNLFFVYSGVVAVIAAFFGGGAVGRWLAFEDMVLAIFIGAIILAIIGGLTGYIGASTGCSTYVNTRYAFGRVGSWIVGVALITITTGIGWFAFETWLFGVIINVIGPVTGTAIDNLWTIGTAAIWGGILMMITAAVGYRGLSYLSYITVPGFVLLSIIGIWAAVEGAGGLGALSTAVPASPAPLTVGITGTVGTYIAGAIITSDIARFARRSADGSIAWMVQVLTLFPLLMIGGGVMVLLTGTENPAIAMAAAGMGIGVFLMAITGQWTTNDNNLYSGALAISNFTRWKKAYITIAIGIIGTGYAAYIGFTAFGSFEPFMNFIVTLGSILPAMAGVYIADFYVVQPLVNGKRDPKARYNFRPGAKIPEVNVAGVIALVIGASIGGIISEIALANVVAGVPVLKDVFSIGAINALVVAILAYLAIVGLCKAAKISYTAGVFTQSRTGL